MVQTQADSVFLPPICLQRGERFSFGIFIVLNRIFFAACVPPPPTALKVAQRVTIRISGTYLHSNYSVDEEQHRDQQDDIGEGLAGIICLCFAMS